MKKIHIVATSIGVGARVIGAYTNADVAECVRKVAWDDGTGDGALVTSVTIDEIDPDLLSAMRSLGIEMPKQA